MGGATGHRRKNSYWCAAGAPPVAGGRLLEATLGAVRDGRYAVEVYGMGYVGLPLAVRLAAGGVRVTGIDTDGGRVERLRAGRLMSSEAHLAGEFGRAVSSGRLSIEARPPGDPGAETPRVGIICVPTPAPGGPEPSAARVMAAAGAFAGAGGGRAGDVLVIESSVGSGTTDAVRRMVESRGRAVGEDYGLAFCPERIDPANKRWGLENIPRVVYCSDDLTFGVAAEVYGHVNSANLLRVSSAAAAEVVKSYENAFRLVNISLVNELAVLCDALGIDSREVISAAATKPFGFMPFAPGAGAGGHCIPKDPRFLSDAARRSGGPAFASIDSALATNAAMPGYVCGRILDRIVSMGLPRTAVVCGMAYKADVEDMRDSPGFRIAAGLAARRFEVRTFDPFHDDALVPRYLAENGMGGEGGGAGFEAVGDLGAGTLRGTSCLCVVQHHASARRQVEEAYASSLVPVVYDCQNRLRPSAGSRAVLDRLGAPASGAGAAARAGGRGES